MTLAIFWLLNIAAMVCLYKAWPFIQAMRRKSPFSYVFPTEKNVAQPEFAPMWKYLARFYGTVLFSIGWGLLFQDIQL